MAILRYGVGEIPEGWAGGFMIKCNYEDVDTWAHDNLENPKNNIIIKNYGYNLCEVMLRKRKDLTLALLRWK